MRASFLLLARTHRRGLPLKKKSTSAISSPPPINLNNRTMSDNPSPKLRSTTMRRSVSMANYEEITGEEKKERLKQPDKP